MYEYRAFVTEVYDADTLTADIDLGLRTWAHGQKLRVYGINAPEMKGPEKAKGILARDRARELLFPLSAGPVTIRTHKDKTEKYGRWLAEVTLQDGRDLAAVLLAEGHAVEALYE